MNTWLEWIFIVESFTKRNPTLDKDRLLALSSVAAVLHSYTIDDYISGLWKSNSRWGCCGDNGTRL